MFFGVLLDFPQDLFFRFRLVLPELLHQQYLLAFSFLFPS